MSKRIDITLLAHNHSDLTLRCLNRLRENTYHPYRLIFVDNDSRPIEYNQVFVEINRNFPNHIIKRLSENKFYAAGVNEGLKLSMKAGYSKYIVTLSNDVFVTENWLTKMISIMENNQAIGVLSPLTDNISRCCANAAKMTKSLGLLKPGEALRMVNYGKERFYFTPGNVPLFCGMIRRRVIEKIGYLDERFFILGNDDDYADRTRLAGFKTCIALNVFVNHIHGATKHEVFPQPGRARIKARHKELLRRKKESRRRTGSLA